MALQVTKASQFLQQWEGALLDDSVFIEPDTLVALAASVTELLRAAVDLGDRGRLYANASRIRRRQGLMRGLLKPDDHASDDLDDNDLPPAPTEEEIAAATEKARRPDGTVNPYALAAALAIPMKGRVRSDDRGVPGRSR